MYIWTLHRPTRSDKTLPFQSAALCGVSTWQWLKGAAVSLEFMFSTPGVLFSFKSGTQQNLSELIALWQEDNSSAVHFRQSSVHSIVYRA